MKYIKTTEKVTVENYPYGYVQKTTAFYSIEHVEGKGFRTVFQNINPKTGALNAPKKSVYYKVAVLKQEDDGKVRTHALDFYGDEGLVKDMKFMADNFELFTLEQIKSIALNIISVLRANIYAKVSDQTKLLPFFDSAMKNMVAIAKTGDNLFGNVKYDIEGIKSLEVEGYNPFTVTSH